jgi:hypothetical protein
MTTSKLRDLKTLGDVARACGVDVEFVRQYAESNRQQFYYEALKLSKRGKRRRGEFRVVFAAREERLRQLHRGLSMIVANSAEFGPHVQGFVKKRSTRTNAEQHIGARIVLHADIKGFFDAITTEHVRVAFVEHGVSGSMAETLAKICTIDGRLRQGTRCSPTIANLVCFDMDQAFGRLAKATGSTYTRYADDISFSGDEVPSDDSVRAVLKSRDFELRDGQCFRQRRGRVQFVTGLSVADRVAPRLPRRLKRQLRLVMHFVEKYGLQDHIDRSSDGWDGSRVAWLGGILRYAHSIEPDRVSKWLKIFEAAVVERLRNRQLKATD